MRAHKDDNLARLKGGILMSILSIIGAAFKLLVMFMKGTTERDKERKAKLKEARGELKEAIHKRDPGSVLRAISKSRRV